MIVWRNYGIILHREEETRAQLRPWCPGIEERGRRVREVALRHQVVGLERSVDVLAVDANGHTHEHVLRTLGDLASDLEQVGALQRDEREER